MDNIDVDFSENIIKDIICQQTKNDIKILSTEKEYVIPPGENYISELVRITVKFCENDSKDVKSMSVISKTPLQKDIESGRDEKMKFFASEIAFYSEVLPMLNKLEYTTKITPNPYYASKTPKKRIVLEDLSLLQYKMCNRLEGLDLDHCLLTMEKVAYLHAASLLLYEQNPTIMDIFKKDEFYKDELFKKWDSIAFKEMLSACQRKPNLEKYVNLITQDLMGKCSALRKIDPKFNVFNHGDLWCNNLMFQYNEDGYLNDVLFVDFQVATFTSPFYDLHFFLATTPNLEVKKTHTNTILKHYYDAFCKNVDVFKLKTKIPTCEEFNKEFCAKAYMGLGVTVTTMHLFKADKREDASITNFLKNEGEGSFRHHCFNNANYLAYLESSLSFYEKLGLFDR
ncbi:hypothetical protein FQR65_LT02070 [Abscondita terminalis]|nr:hypothetical protein FQR65_LT02070 [Abscondita terminalis]